MDARNYYNNLLLKYADYLKKNSDAIKTSDPETVTFDVPHQSKQYEALCFTWIFNSLIDAFPNDWGLTDDDNPVLCDEPNGNTIEGIFTFFNLNMFEFCNLFCPWLQEKEMFGCEEMTMEATALEIAENIERFTKHRIKK